MTLSSVLRPALVAAVAVVGSYALLIPSAPEGLTGSWMFALTLDTGRDDLANVVVHQDGDALTGTYRGRGNRVATLAGVVTTETVEFSLEGARIGVATCVGTIRARAMDGTCDYGAGNIGTWEATRGSLPLWER